VIENSLGRWDQLSRGEKDEILGGVIHLDGEKSAQKKRSFSMLWDNSSGVAQAHGRPEGKCGFE